MSQFGMTMPGAQVQRAASMNIYTGLLALAALGLLGACVFVYMQGSKIAPDGQPIQVHQFDQATKKYTITLP